MSKVFLEKPPVIELVIGAQFDGPVFSSEYLYNFYQKIKSDFPKIQENPPLPAIIEGLTEPNQNRLLQGFHTRRFFINESDDRLIQLQGDKILFNWRKTSVSNEYPKFSTVLVEFQKIFKSITESNEDVQKKVNQLEVTFVDHVFLDEFGLDSYEINEIFQSISFNMTAKALQLNMSFPCESINGNLTLNIKSAHSNQDKRKLIVCETTCRGMKKGAESNEEWYNRAHDILVDYFISLFSDKAKLIWGIKS